MTNGLTLKQILLIRNGNIAQFSLISTERNWNHKNGTESRIYFCLLKSERQLVVEVEVAAVLAWPSSVGGRKWLQHSSSHGIASLYLTEP